MLLLLLACTPPTPSENGERPPLDTDSDTDSDADTDTYADTYADTDTDTDLPTEGVLVLCGGGGEGEMEDTTAWSATAYAAAIAGGDVSGDGRVRVAVISDSEQTEWVPNYFEWLGADEAFNLQVDSVEAADDPALVDTFAAVDPVFIKGGDQGSYYDLWNDTELERQIVALYTNRHGGISGTTAGAMSQSEYSLTGSNDYVTSDVLLDSRTAYLDDVSDGGTGVHDDFLGLLPATLVDTHYSTRGRLGRLAGMMARAIDEGGPEDLLGIVLDEQTCVTVREGRATVNGVGSVVFLTQGAERARRVPGEPLVWAGLPLDRPTEGWVNDLDARATLVDAPPAGAEPIAPAAPGDAQPAVDWSVSGTRLCDQVTFEIGIDAWSDAYAARAGTGDPRLMNTVGLMNAHDSGLRGVNDEVLFRTLYDYPEVKTAHRAARTPPWPHRQSSRRSRTVRIPSSTIGGCAEHPPLGTFGVIHGIQSSFSRSPSASARAARAQLAPAVGPRAQLEARSFPSAPPHQAHRRKATRPRVAARSPKILVQTWHTSHIQKIGTKPRVNRPHRDTVWRLEVP